MHSILAILIAAAPVPVPPAPLASGLPQATGVVEGVVRLHLRPPRRVANRYPGKPAGTHAVQSLPAVVWIRGSIPGVGNPPLSPVPVMAQQDTAFVPAARVIPVGTTVRFPNEDTFFHNVFSYSKPARFDLGRYPRGEAKEVTFDEPGIVKVYCEVHEFMRAAIVVTENPFAAVLDGDGRFRFAGVPAGTYTLVAWHPDLGMAEREIRVEAGGALHIDLDLK
ncbi:MAG: carboxypeptidase regulatory-like domain-containing protein [Gemmatimonadota bacterium]